MKITMVIHGISTGRAERVLRIMANYWWSVRIAFMCCLDDGSLAPILHLNLNRK